MAEPNPPAVFTTNEPYSGPITTSEGTLAPVHGEGPVAFGFVGPTAWVSLAMLILIIIALFMRVPRAIIGGLDSKIAAIRAQLDDAKTLRVEAEALRDEYRRKIEGAEADAETMLAGARDEAKQIVARADADATALIGRRERMAADSIAAAERAAVEDVRQRVAQSATAASRLLIAQRHSAADDRQLADQLIGSI